MVLGISICGALSCTPPRQDGRPTVAQAGAARVEASAEPVASPTPRPNKHCHGSSPFITLRAIGAPANSVDEIFGRGVAHDIGCECIDAAAHVALVWAVIDHRHDTAARAWSEHPDSTSCLANAFGGLRSNALSDATLVYVFQDDDQSRQVPLPGPSTKEALTMTILGTTVGASWPNSELSTTLAVASEPLALCAKAPARALVRIDIDDSRFEGVEVAGTTEMTACVKAALVGRALYHAKGESPKRAALVLELEWPHH
jgi:hypothetical protein